MDIQTKTSLHDLRNSYPARIFAVFMAVNMLLELCSPVLVYALTSGPGQPEFSNFEPVATTDMVNPFSGDFTYNLPIINVPGPDGSDYPLSLSYHSGLSPESEASWVGYGWTLNPGAISRNKRGFPDDYKGAEVTYHNKMPKNYTVSAGGTVGVELFGFDIGEANATLRYNNYKGFSAIAGVGLTFEGIVSLGYSVANGDGSFSYSVNPARLLSLLKLTKLGDGGGTEAKSSQSLDKAIKKKLVSNAKKYTMKSVKSAAMSYGAYIHGEQLRASNVTEYQGRSWNVAVNVEPTVSPLPIGPEVGLKGNYTWQENIPEDVLKAYGYMYTADAWKGNKANNIMDYYAEKESTFTKRDKTLSIPFSNADSYMVSGEGLGGGFRLHNRNTGHFTPNEKTSNTEIINAGVEIQAGLNIGLGADLAVGFQSLTVKDWDDPGNATDYSFAEKDFETDDPLFFRFANDLGGTVEYGEDNTAISAGLTSSSEGYKPVLDAGEFPMELSSSMVWEGVADPVNRSGRSSYIDYHLNKDMAATAYRSYSKQADVENFANRDEDAISEGVGEFALTNDIGNRYVYGLPVYSREEANLQFGVSASSASGNHLVYNENGKVKIGEERHTPYAASYLLTEITTSDYTDRTMDGPTPDDFGGYTRFNYKQSAGDLMGHSKSGDLNGWYKWRIPYTGLLYNRNQFSDIRDDMGSVLYGYKELYYLESIETKTHIAVFHTSDRDDGLEAHHNEGTAITDPAAKGTQRLQKLDKIELFAKGTNGAPDQLIKTVHFNYDYSLSQGVPNSVNGGGKLTLKKLWFEYNGIQNARISPYRFEYEYPDMAYPAKYSDLTMSGDYTAGAQNPDYHPHDIDRWGNYQQDNDGAPLSRRERYNKWGDQNPGTSFDPASWHLKRIFLPSGGEIHVQYEQDDYHYVQDRTAMTMVSLSDQSMDWAGNNDNTATYYLNVDEDLGLDDDEKVLLIERMQKEFIDQKKKIYFKFLYNLKGAPPELENCNVEYIDGYIGVREVGQDGNGIFLKLGNISSGGVTTKKSHTIPWKVCFGYYDANRKGFGVNSSGSCSTWKEAIKDKGKAKDMVMGLLAKIKEAFVPDMLEVCTEVNYEHSYLRIPVARAKKGGGVRVKRLLTYDPGLESGDARLYGSEYNYTTEDELGNTISSGVAGNEPSTGREENALVIDLSHLIPSQSDASKLVSGGHKRQLEGPIGESVLPGASVGYSKVTVRNIHQGRTNRGYSVHEYYTHKDYPYDGYYTTLQSSGVEMTPITQEAKQFHIPAILYNHAVSNVWATQGYRFVQHSMHGQVKKVATYAEGADAPSIMQEYGYFEPGEVVPMYTGFGEEYELRNPGKEMEIVMERRSVQDIADNIALEFDLSIGNFILFAIPFVTLIPSVSHSESKLSTHVTSKVVRYPAIRKWVHTVKNDLEQWEHNRAFNPETGLPVVTTTHDDYHGEDLQQSYNHNGTYTSYVFPASEHYKGMGQKAFNQGKIIRSNADRTIEKHQVNAATFYLQFETNNGGDNCSSSAGLVAGDLIRVFDDDDEYGELYHISLQLGNICFLLPSGAYNPAPPAGFQSGVHVEVIRSGRSNQLAASRGSLITYGEERAIVHHPVDPAILAPRQEFVALLNAKIAEGATVIHADEMPDGLTVLNSSGECVDAKDYMGIDLDITSGSTIPRPPEIKCKEGADVLTVVIDASPDIIFELDPETSQVVYYPDEEACVPLPIPCLVFCPLAYPTNTLDGVLAASATVYSDFWPWQELIYGASPAGYNDYEKGMRGKWRPVLNYAYKTDLKRGNGESLRTYTDAGVYEDFTLFDWKHLFANNKWTATSWNTFYAPHGQVQEQLDALGIYSSTKYGYHHAVPYAISKNAPYTSIQFESFENTYARDGSNYLEEGLLLNNAQGSIDEAVAHAGSRSMKLNINLGYGFFTTQAMICSQQLKEKGFAVKVWLKEGERLWDHAFGRFECLVDNLTSPGVTIDPVDFKRIARVGEWSLYEARVTDLGDSNISTDLIQPKIRIGMWSEDIWIDDLRVQPLDAEMTAYVYDPVTLRMITSFDDQHFGMYYQYNSEGQLVRKMAETERGMKTIQETQYHTPSVLRSDIP